MTGQRILVVDDTPANIRLLEALLAPEGLAVETASSGEEALALIAQSPPDLVLLDLLMPGIDGHETCRRIRADTASANLAVIMVTSSGEQEKLTALEGMESQFFEGGANGSAELLPKDAAGREARMRKVRQGFMDRSAAVARQYRAKLEELYGKERGAKVEHAEAFEVCEYGSQPSAGELRRLFPFFDGAAEKKGGAN